MDIYTLQCVLNSRKVLRYSQVIILVKMIKIKNWVIQQNLPKALEVFTSIYLHTVTNNFKWRGFF